jgi:predicted RNase H-like HicB family nuclease
MSIEREHEIVLQPEPEGGFSVFVPNYQASPPRARRSEEAIEAYLEVMHGDGLPNPDRPPQQHCCPRGVSPKLPAASQGLGGVETIHRPSAKRLAGT